jgi:hypothetical protein
MSGYTGVYGGDSRSVFRNSSDARPLVHIRVPPDGDICGGITGVSFYVAEHDGPARAVSTYDAGRHRANFSSAPVRTAIASGGRLWSTYGRKSESLVGLDRVGVLEVTSYGQVAKLIQVHGGSDEMLVVYFKEWPTV